MPDVDYVLSLDGVAETLPVLSWRWGMAASAAVHAGGGGGAGKVDVDELVVLANGSLASPAFVLACATGRHLREATLTGSQTVVDDTSTFLTITIGDVQVVGYRVSADQDEQPMDEIALAFRTVVVERHEADGTTARAGWDVAASREM